MGPVRKGDLCPYWHFLRLSLIQPLLSRPRLISVTGAWSQPWHWRPSRRTNLFPLIVSEGKDYFARWLPVLDSPKDAARLKQLEDGDAGCVPRWPSRLIISRRRILLATVSSTPSATCLRVNGEKLPRRSFTRMIRLRIAGWKRCSAKTQLSNFHRRRRKISLQVTRHGCVTCTSRAMPPSGLPFAWKRPRCKKQPWHLHYLIQAKDDPSLLIPADEVWKKTRGALTHLGHRFEQPQEKLLTGLGYAATFIPARHRKPEKQTSHRTGSGHQRRVHLSARDRAPARRRGLWHPCPAVVEQEGRAAGCQSEDEIQQEQVRHAKSRMSMENLVNYQWKLSLGETELTEAEFKALAKLKSPLVQIRGQWVTLGCRANRSGDQVLGEASSSKAR